MSGKVIQGVTSTDKILQSEWATQVYIVFNSTGMPAQLQFCMNKRVSHSIASNN